MDLNQSSDEILWMLSYLYLFFFSKIGRIDLAYKGDELKDSWIPEILKYFLNSSEIVNCLQLFNLYPGNQQKSDRNVLLDQMEDWEAKDRTGRKIEDIIFFI